LIDGKSRQEGNTKLSGASWFPQVTVQDLKEKTMIHTDEDDEFARIERENAMKGQPYYYKPSTEWKSLTDEEIQNALGITADSSNWNLVKVLEWAKKIEAAMLEKNK
jgi:hypothetical protein